MLLKSCTTAQTITFDEEVAIKAAQAAAIAAAAKEVSQKAEKELLWEDQACMRCRSKVQGFPLPSRPMDSGTTAGVLQSWCSDGR